MLVSINLPIIYFNLYFIYPSTVFPNPLKYAVDNIATSKRIPEHERVDALFFYSCIKHERSPNKNRA